MVFQVSQPRLENLRCTPHFSVRAETHFTPARMDVEARSEPSDAAGYSEFQKFLRRALLVH